MRTPLMAMQLALMTLAASSLWAQNLLPVTKDYLIDEYGERRAFSRAVARAARPSGLQVTRHSQTRTATTSRATSKHRRVKSSG